MRRRWLRLSLALALIAFAGCIPTVRAAPPVPIETRIADLEREVARGEQAKAPVDKTREMQLLLAMAQLSALYVEADRISEAWPLGEKMLPRLEKLLGPDHPNVVTQLEANAASYGLQGRYAEAEKLRKRAIAINERIAGADSLATAMSLQGMAGLFRLQERYDDALAYAERALAVADRKLPAGDTRGATFLSQVADIHMSQRRFDQAEPLYRRALELLDRAPDQARPVVGMQKIQALQSLGLAFLGRGRHAEAQPFIDTAIATSTRVFGPDHLVTGVMLMTLANQLLDQDQLEEAERLFRQALPINERNGKAHASLGDSHLGLGIVDFKRQNWREAYRRLGEASRIAILREQIATAGGTGAIRNRVTPSAETFLITAMAAYRTAETQPPDFDALRDDAFRLVQQAERSAVGGALAQMSARVSAGTGALGRLVRERQDLAVEWRRLDASLEKALLAPAAQRAAGIETETRGRLTAISQRLADIDTRMVTDFPAMSKISDPAPLSIGDVQRLLGPAEVLVTFAHRLNQTLAFAIRRDTVAWALVPIGDEELEREIRALRCGLDTTAWQGDGAAACASATGTTPTPGGPLPFDLDRAHRLYAAFLGPFAGMTADADLLVATSGPFATLPLHVLLTDAPSGARPPVDVAGSGDPYVGVRWLGRRNAIVSLPSVASLKALRTGARASSAPRPFFGVANPVLDGPDASYAGLAAQSRANRTCAVVSRTATVRVMRGPSRVAVSLSGVGQTGAMSVDVLRAQVPLPETADEVCAVARGFGVGDADVRLAERATKTEIRRLDANGELAKYRVLHFATHGALPDEASAGAEPGLILSPPAAGTAADDGYLAASEIAALKLDADWVILSACNTAGAGRASGEAMSGLARAFFFAQARSVLASHWAVDSAAAVTLVTTMATAIQREPRIGRAEALRRAMLAMIDGGGDGRSHPSVWAPFVLVGESGAVR